MRLLKLAALALFGYAIYEFFRGVMQDPQLRAQADQAFGRFSQGEGRGRDERGRFTSSGSGSNISGPGEGVEQSTLENDGGSVSHKVGRGVIS